MTPKPRPALLPARSSPLRCDSSPEPRALCLKAWIWGTFHGVSEKHMQRYLDEFVYGFNMSGHTNRCPVSSSELAILTTSVAFVSWLSIPNASMTAQRPPL